MYSGEPITSLDMDFFFFGGGGGGGGDTIRHGPWQKITLDVSKSIPCYGFLYLLIVRLPF